MPDSVVKSVFWNMMNRYLPSIIQIISTILISRHIFPGDFGAVALVLTFSQIIQIIVSSGFSQALIYKVNNSDTLYSTVFWINLLVSIFFYMLFFFLSGAIEKFYHIENIGLLIKIVGINIVVYGFTYIQSTLFIIKIDFKTPALSALFATIISCTIAIILAYKGWGIWAIVTQTLGINFLQTVLLWYFSSWHPVFKFSIKELREIFPYSVRIFINDFIQSVYDNIHALVLGKVFPIENLGYYNRMQSIVGYTTSNFMYTLSTVFIPILCAKKEDDERAKESFSMVMRISNYLALPLLIILIVYARPIISIILTDKWLGGVEILQIVSTAFLLVPFTYVSESFLKIRNKPGVLMNTGFIKKVIGILILFIAIRFNLIYVCWGLVLYNIVSAAICLYCNKRYLGISNRSQVCSVLNVILLNVIFAGVLYLFTLLLNNYYLRIMGGVLFGMLAYIAIPYFFKIKEYYIINTIIRRTRNKE